MGFDMPNDSPPDKAEYEAWEKSEATLIYTIAQVAAICKVAPRTVSKWFDSGRLKGYRIPGSQDRRVPRTYLLEFLKKHGMETYVPVGNGSPQPTPMPSSTDELIRGAIDETRELVAALPQELFDLRKLTADQQATIERLEAENEKLRAVEVAAREANAGMSLEDRRLSIHSLGWASLSVALDALAEFRRQQV